MSLSEIFLKAAELMERRKASLNFGMCAAIEEAIAYIENKTKRINVHMIVSAHFSQERDDCIEILRDFSPKHVDTDAYWFTKNSIDDAYKVKTWEEAKRLRTDILLWCSAIAESEGL